MKIHEVSFVARLISNTWNVEALQVLTVFFTVFGQTSLALRRHYDPAMFEPENLARILCPEKYEYVLDRWVFHSSSPFR